VRSGPFDAMRLTSALASAKRGRDAASMKHGPPSSTPPRRAVARRRTDAGGETARWLASHRGRAAIQPPPQAGRAAARLLKPLAAKFGPGASELDEHWSAIAGEALAAYTRPEKFQSGAGGLTLVIRARGPAAALAEARSAVILERVARYCGKKPKKLKIVQGALAPAQSPVKPRRARITKSPDLDKNAQTLDTLMETFRRAVEQREGVSLPPRRANPGRSDDQ